MWRVLLFRHKVALRVKFAVHFLRQLIAILIVFGRRLCVFWLFIGLLLDRGRLTRNTIVLARLIFWQLLMHHLLLQIGRSMRAQR